MHHGHAGANTYEAFCEWASWRIRPLMQAIASCATQNGLKPERITPINLKVHPPLSEPNGHDGAEGCGFEGKFSVFRAVAVATVHEVSARRTAVVHGSGMRAQ